jgi:hypothetical protein
MKTSNKLVLGLSGILAVSVGIGVTATYAWFRISRAANVNITDTTVVGEGSSLTIAYYQLGDDESALLPTDATKTKNGFDISAATNTITDISGDGVDFYKPNWDPNAAETEDIALSFTKVKNTTLKSYYIRFGISFTNSGQSAFDIYFNDGCKVTANTATETDPDEKAAQQAKNDQAAKTTRLALWNENHVTCKSIWQPDTTDGTAYTDYKYIAPSTDATKTVYTVPGYDFYNPAVDLFHAGNFDHLASAPATGSEVKGQKLVNVPANTTIKTEVAIWTEGTLSSTVNSAQGGHIGVTLSFIAL